LGIISESPYDACEHLARGLHLLQFLPARKPLGFFHAFSAVKGLGIHIVFECGNSSEAENGLSHFDVAGFVQELHGQLGPGGLSGLLIGFGSTDQVRKRKVPDLGRQIWIDLAERGEIL
jgi:hypothetical protein